VTGRRPGRIAGCSVGRSVGRIVGRSAGRSVGRSVGRIAGRIVGRRPQVPDEGGCASVGAASEHGIERVCAVAPSVVEPPVVA